MAHSKRNTSRSVFTSYERDMAKAAWASTSARLSRDSFLPFGSCYLCLEIARDPVSCSHGDIFCRECAVANLLAQKKEIKRLERARDKAEQEILEAQVRQDADAQERAIKEFEKIQAGFNTSSVAVPSSSGLASKEDVTTGADADSVTRQGTKRKFILDQDELERIAKEDRTKAQKSIDEEKASKEKLPSFWTPSQTPDAEAARKAAGAAAVPKKIKLAPICPASPDDSQHPYSLKSLIPLNFKEELDPKTNSNRRMCPSCVKTLGNASRPLLAEKCGHVICRSCAAKFMTPVKGSDASLQENACYVCDARLTAARSNGKQKQRKQEFVGLIELRSEGTGFSARGASKVEKSGVAFQC
ncbi:RING finger domain-containing protein [Colletotrichum tofieldiae]|uniref:RING finger domain-containing protein n=1 Tax=Colletotrichum tofieldiae TaxID=708197 RepID=A0A166Q034_9PEZI|nr:RING finger domain-containing protein [Colletotrichum tofieldiae]GKT53586.1 RING finger domain-containing protein [Colletotrichum tofieldiae]GKT73336.1 RING finger domain-containing protein [Colletotrichum tofieldiae]GKT87985.1 RING finger domain-containing protein [Colletotrichum tofieldiae]